MKIINHNKNDPFCPLVKVAENVISKGVRFININGSSSKCFCPTCYQQRNDSNHLFKGKNSDTSSAYGWIQTLFLQILKIFLNFIADFFNFTILSDSLSKISQKLKNLMSPDRRILEKKDFTISKKLTHNNVFLEKPPVR